MRTVFLVIILLVVPFVSAKTIILETRPTASVNWSDITGIPSGFADGVDNGSSGSFMVNDVAESFYQAGSNPSGGQGDMYFNSVSDKLMIMDWFAIGDFIPIATENYVATYVLASSQWTDQGSYKEPNNNDDINISVDATQRLFYNNSEVCTADNGLCGGSSLVNISDDGRGVLITGGAIVRGTVNQTDNLQEWQDSTGTLLSGVDENGHFGIGLAPQASRKLTVFGDGNPTVYFRDTSGSNGIIVQELSALGNAAKLRFATAGNGGRWDWVLGSQKQMRYDSADGNSKVTFEDTSRQYSIYTDSVGVSIGHNTATASLDVHSTVTTDVGLVVQGAPAQSANLQEWQDSSGDVLASFTPEGNLETFEEHDHFGTGYEMVRCTADLGNAGVYYQTNTGVEITTPFEDNGMVFRYKIEYLSEMGGYYGEAWVGGYTYSTGGDGSGFGHSIGDFPWTTVTVGNATPDSVGLYLGTDDTASRYTHFRIVEVQAFNLAGNTTDKSSWCDDVTISFDSSMDIENWGTDVLTHYTPDAYGVTGSYTYNIHKYLPDNGYIQQTGSYYTYPVIVNFPDVIQRSDQVRGIIELTLYDGVEYFTTLKVSFVNDHLSGWSNAWAIMEGNNATYLNSTFMMAWDSNDELKIVFEPTGLGTSGLHMMIDHAYLVGLDNGAQAGADDFTITRPTSLPSLPYNQTYNITYGVIV